MSNGTAGAHEAGIGPGPCATTQAFTWVFVQSFVLMAGGFIGPVIRRITPRAALLSTLAGVSLAFISMRPAMSQARSGKLVTDLGRGGA